MALHHGFAVIMACMHIKCDCLQGAQPTGTGTRQGVQKRLVTPRAKPPAPDTQARPAAEPALAQQALPANQVAKAHQDSRFERVLHLEEADMPLGMFPSTQQSTSQQGSKLLVKPSAAPISRSAPGAGAGAPPDQDQTDEQRPRLPSQQQQQQQQKQQRVDKRHAQQPKQQLGNNAQQQPGQGQGHLRPPSMSPSGSSTAKPPNAVRWRSGNHKVGSLELDRLAEGQGKQPAGQQQPQLTPAPPSGAKAGAQAEGKDEDACGQGNTSQAAAAAEKRKDRTQVTRGDASAVAGKGGASGNKRGDEGGWISRRASKAGQVQQDAPALQETPSKQASVQQQGRALDVKAAKHGAQPGNLHGPDASQQGQRVVTDGAEPKTDQARGSSKQLVQGQDSKQPLDRRTGPAAQVADAVMPLQTCDATGNKGNTQQSGSAAGKSAHKHTPTSKGISQLRPGSVGESLEQQAGIGSTEGAMGTSQKAGDGTAEGQTPTNGAKVGGWTGRLKSLFTLSGRGAHTTP